MYWLKKGRKYIHFIFNYYRDPILNVCFGPPKSQDRLYIWIYINMQKCMEGKSNDLNCPVHKYKIY